MKYCKACGTTGKPVTKPRGHFLLELAPWAIFLWLLWQGMSQVFNAARAGHPLENNAAWQALSLGLIVFFFIGVVATMTRRLGTKQQCEKCGSLEVIPIDSPIAQREIYAADKERIRTELRAQMGR